MLSEVPSRRNSKVSRRIKSRRKRVRIKKLIAVILWSFLEIQSFMMVRNHFFCCLYNLDFDDDFDDDELD